MPSRYVSAIFHRLIIALSKLQDFNRVSPRFRHDTIPPQTVADWSEMDDPWSRMNGLLIAFYLDIFGTEAAANIDMNQDTTDQYISSPQAIARKYCTVFSRRTFMSTFLDLGLEHEDLFWMPTSGATGSRFTPCSTCSFTRHSTKLPLLLGAQPALLYSWHVFWPVFSADDTYTHLDPCPSGWSSSRSQ